MTSGHSIITMESSELQTSSRLGMMTPLSISAEFLFPVNVPLNTIPSLSAICFNLVTLSFDTSTDWQDVKSITQEQLSPDATPSWLLCHSTAFCLAFVIGVTVKGSISGCSPGGMQESCSGRFGTRRVLHLCCLEIDDVSGLCDVHSRQDAEILVPWRYILLGGFVLAGPFRWLVLCFRTASVT
jgi:hypothetical protein